MTCNIIYFQVDPNCYKIEVLEPGPGSKVIILFSLFELNQPTVKFVSFMYSKEIRSLENDANKPLQDFTLSNPIKLNVNSSTTHIVIIVLNSYYNTLQFLNITLLNNRC